MAELLTVPRIGRKTVNVILRLAMEKAEGIVIDTHHIRLSERLGLSKQKTVDKIEKEMIGIVPKKDGSPGRAR